MKFEYPTRFRLHNIRESDLAHEYRLYNLPELSVSHDFSVLIVEDDDDARQNMEDILSLDGYSVQSVTHCLPAITAIESDSFDAVIVDWRLPDENADQLIPIILNHQPDTPVVVVTGMRDFDTAVTALRSGVYDFLLKPVNPDILRSLLRRIVERKQHLAELDAARDKILMNERLAAIGQMVSGLAHESRNAFQRSHACLAELTLDLDDKPQSVALVRKVQKALDDLHLLLEEVRNYSAPIVLERRHCCLESLVRETWQQILDAPKSDSVPAFSVVATEDFPKDCYVDCNRMQRVIRNLLENAFFACSIPGHIEVHLSFDPTNDALVRLEVTDDGEGVAECDRERIFTPFFTTKTKGTGLGLAMSRRYVDAHDGRIFADTSEAGGARMVVELPYSTK